MVREEQITFNSGGKKLFGIAYTPACTPAVGVIVCNPLFEERKSSQRVLVETARALAAAGCSVLRFDYRGCGDSEGDFADFSVEHWMVDIRCARETLQQQTDCPLVGLLGLRFGANLGLACASTDPSFTFLALWQPILDGETFVMEELRKKLIKEMVTFGQSRTTRDGLVEKLKGGQRIDLDGYALSSTLYHDLCRTDFTEETPPVSCSVQWVQIGPGTSVAPPIERFRADVCDRGGSFELLRAQERPFWNLIGLAHCPALIDSTVRWITQVISCPSEGSD